MTPHTDEELLAAARALADPARLYFTTRANGQYHIFRRSYDKTRRAIWVGKARTAAELLHHIQRLAAVK